MHYVSLAWSRWVWCNFAQNNKRKGCLASLLPSSLSVSLLSIRVLKVKPEWHTHRPTPETTCCPASCPCLSYLIPRVLLSRGISRHGDCCQHRSVNAVVVVVVVLDDDVISADWRIISCLYGDQLARARGKVLLFLQEIHVCTVVWVLCLRCEEDVAFDHWNDRINLEFLK